MREKSVTLSFYDLSVPTFLQTVRAVGGFLDGAVIHCAEVKADPDDIVQARLFPDMAPFHFQIEALVHHAVWGLEAVKTGVFAPPPLIGAMPFSDLQTMVAQAITALETFTADEVNRWSGRKLNIELHRPLDEEDAWITWEPRTLAFTSETFLLSFSLPNFHYHAVTAYNILRSRGVPLGKRDYEGRLRVQTA
jgi:hypothetical protein